MSEIKVALAGAGAFGTKHLDGIRNIDGVEVVSLIGRELEKTQGVAQKYDIEHVSTNLDDALVRVLKKIDPTFDPATDPYFAPGAFAHPELSRGTPQLFATKNLGTEQRLTHETWYYKWPGINGGFRNSPEEYHGISCE